MKEATNIMKNEIIKTDLKKPLVPIISNVTSKEENNPNEIKKLLIQQIENPVRWRESLITMADGHGITNFFEIGPGKVLASTVKRTIPNAKVLSVGLAPQIDQALEMIND